MYNIIRELLFLLPPEQAHKLTMQCLKAVIKPQLTRKIAKNFWNFNRPEDEFTLDALKFPNKVGLAAGFDKSAHYLPIWDFLGFGFVEVGTVTPLPQPGNPQPRLFRITADQALINRMGFNNHGVDMMAYQLQQWRKFSNSNMIIGGNIGKNKATENQYAWKDYVICINKLGPWVDYFTVNISSPNTPGLRELQTSVALAELLKAINDANAALPNPRPIWLKIAPDQSKEQIVEIVQIAIAHQLAGIVATNTTTSRAHLTTNEAEIKAIGAGGLSGKPLQATANQAFNWAIEAAKNQIHVMASGGIMKPVEALDRLNNGAVAVQLYTGLIYEGPELIKEIVTASRTMKS